MKQSGLLFFLLAICHTFVFGRTNNNKLTITHLVDSFYVYTTYGIADGGPYPANSMYLVTGKGVVMFDTPWDSTQFQPLMDSIEQHHHQPVVLCIATHFHSDRTAGLDFLKRKGIPTYTSKLTYDLCRERNEHQSQFYFANDTTFNIGGYPFQTFYGGPGHSPDNLVIWFGGSKIIYGGCLVKSTENNSLGNIADANLAEWPNTIKKVMKKFPSAEFVIPGHLGWADKNALQHTLKLLRTHAGN